MTKTVRRVLTAAYGIVRDRCGIREFARDESGNYLIITALLMPVLIGSAGLGTEVGLWLYARQNLQAAADSGAISAATSYYYNGVTGDTLTTQATGVTATYGVVDQVNGTVQVNRPPSTGNYTTQAGAVEVIVSQSQGRLMSALWGSQPFTIQARAVALARGGTGCAISLDKTASSAIKVQGNPTVNLIGCSLYDNSSDQNALTVGGSATLDAQSVDVVGCVSGMTCPGGTPPSDITSTQGVSTGDAPAVDPYADVSVPAAPTCGNNQKGLAYNGNKNDPAAPTPGSAICGGLTLNAGADVSLSPGVYYIVGGGLTVNGGATLSGTGVTLVFTSEPGYSYATTNIAGGATVNLTAPTTGATAGIVIYGDPTMTAGTAFKFDGGSTQYFGGAVYIPKGAIDFAGGAASASGCTQLIGDTLTFSGNSNLAINCSAYKTKPIGTVAAKLVE